MGARLLSRLLCRLLAVAALVAGAGCGMPGEASIGPRVHNRPSPNERPAAVLHLKVDGPVTPAGSFRVAPERPVCTHGVAERGWFRLLFSRHEGEGLREVEVEVRGVAPDFSGSPTGYQGEVVLHGPGGREVLELTGGEAMLRARESGSVVATLKGETAAGATYELRADCYTIIRA